MLALLTSQPGLSYPAMTRQARQSRFILVSLLIAVCVAGVSLIASVTYTQTLRAETVANDERVGAHAARLQQHLIAREMSVAAASAVFQPPSAVAARPLEGLEHAAHLGFSDLHSLVWAANVSPQTARLALQATIARGAPPRFLTGWARTPLSPEALPAHSVVVLDILPATRANRSSLGLVLTSLAAPRAALEQARRSGKTTATAPLELVQLPGAPAVVVYSPVRNTRSGEPNPGYLGMSFRYSDLIRQAGNTPGVTPLPFRVVDKQDPQGRILFEDRWTSAKSMLLRRELAFAGRRLEVVYAITPSPQRIALERGLVSGAGAFALGTLVVAAGLWLLRAQGKVDYALATSANAGRQLEIVVEELNHRTKNMMTVVQAIVRRSLAAEPDLTKARADIDDRLQALAKATTLTAPGNRAAVLSTDLVEQLMVGKDLRITISEPKILLSSDAAQSLAMVIHELWTNSCKHGSLAAPEGRVLLTLSAREERFCLNWIEVDALPAIPPKRVGFGRQLLETLAPRALHGDATLEFTPSGVRYELKAPLKQILASTAP